MYPYRYPPFTRSLRRGYGYVAILERVRIRTCGYTRGSESTEMETARHRQRLCVVPSLPRARSWVDEGEGGGGATATARAEARLCDVHICVRRTVSFAQWVGEGEGEGGGEGGREWRRDGATRTNVHVAPSLLCARWASRGGIYGCD